jgi:hypothetical protein
MVLQKVMFGLRFEVFPYWLIIAVNIQQILFELLPMVFSFGIALLLGCSG